MSFQKPVNYAKFDNDLSRHHARYVRFVNSLSKKLTCQECGGAGGEIEPVLDDGTGPFERCGMCEGTGLVTPHMRGLWLKWKKEERAKKT